MNKKKITWQQYAELNDFDFEETYHKRLSGLSWEKAIGKRNIMESVRSLLKDWCADNGKDYNLLLKVSNSKFVEIDDVNIVDKGKVIALANAGWPIKEIAIDCYCTERCVKEVLEARK